jgi:hypothetical protein
MTVEIEKKCLLDGGEEEAQRLVAKLFELDAKTKKTRSKVLLNHYFELLDKELFVESMKALVEVGRRDEFAEVMTAGKTFSVRTRKSNDDVILMVKATKDKSSAVHGVARLEFEQEVRTFTIEELDSFLIKSGCAAIAKWSGHKDSYICMGEIVEVMFSPGYGWMVEVEVVQEDGDTETAEKRVDEILEKLGIQAVDPELVERMYAHYNANWEEFYLTERVFRL